MLGRTTDKRFCNVLGSSCSMWPPHFDRLALRAITLPQFLLRRSGSPSQEITMIGGAVIAIRKYPTEFGLADVPSTVGSGRTNTEELPCDGATAFEFGRSPCYHPLFRLGKHNGHKRIAVTEKRRDV